MNGPTIMGMRPVPKPQSETAYVVWEVESDTPRFGAGVFRTRAEAEAVAGHSMARGQYKPGQLCVKPLMWSRQRPTYH